MSFFVLNLCIHGVRKVVHCFSTIIVLQNMMTNAKTNDQASYVYLFEIVVAAANHATRTFSFFSFVMVVRHCNVLFACIACHI